MAENKKSPGGGQTARGSQKEQRHEYNKPSRLSVQGKLVQTRQWVKSFIVWLACSEIIYAALTAFLLGGLRHD